MQAAHALALGARIVGVALPVLRAYVAGGVDAVELYLRGLCDEIRVALMLAGCARVRDLTPRHVVLHGRLLDWTRQRGEPVRSSAFRRDGIGE
jgi:isopentenyl-diphosphate delta-isomerase